MAHGPGPADRTAGVVPGEVEAVFAAAFRGAPEVVAGDETAVRHGGDPAVGPGFYLAEKIEKTALPEKGTVVRRKQQ